MQKLRDICGAPLLFFLASAVFFSCENRLVTYYSESVTSGPGGGGQGNVQYFYHNFEAELIAGGSSNSTNVSYCPAVNLLVYQKETVPGNYDIYSIKPDGTNEIRLTSHAANETRPAFSPSGMYIAFYRNNHVYVMNSDGAGLRQVSQSLVDSQYPIAFTDDSRQLVVTALDNGKKYISIIGVLGGGEENLTPLTGGYNHSLVPNSDMIVFVAGTQSDQLIYTVHYNGLSQRRIISERSTYRDPVFSQDGSLMAFSRRMNSHYDIYVMTANGASIRQMTFQTTDEVTPRFVPGGRWIAFNQVQSSNTDISFVSVDGKYIVNYTNTLTSVDKSPVFDPYAAVMYFQSDIIDSFNIWVSSLEDLFSIY